MNYIFDVCLNFNKELYDFYEWNIDDKVEFFLKIPIIKLEDSDINNFINNNIKVNALFLKKIFNKSQKYYKNTIKNNKYSCIFSSNNKCIAINFDDNGFIDSRSNLSLEEETEVLEFSKFLKYSLIDYKIIKKNSFKNSFYTRKEINMIETLNKYLNKLIEDKNIEEMEYIYYEIYNEKSNNFDVIKQKLFNAINYSDNKRNKFLELYNLVS